MRNDYRLVILSLVLILALSSCSTGSATPTPANGAYPDPASIPYVTATTGAYPAPAEATANAEPQAYPGPGMALTPTATFDPSAVPFRIDKPVYAGATEVAGSGPPGAPIMLSDVTFMGKEIVGGEIGPDGRFLLVLPAPLEANHRIGIAPYNVEGTKWESVNFENPGYFGDEYQLAPMVGFFFDTVLVVAQ